MSLKAALFSSFRSSTLSISSRSLPRIAHSHLSVLSRTTTIRHYSDHNTTTPEQDNQKNNVQDTKLDEKLSSETADKLKARDAEVVDLTGRLRYLQADFINLQRNSAREKEQTRDYAITKFASDLLETVDVLAIALKSVPQAALAKGESISSDPLPKTPEGYLQELHTGVELTHRLLLQTLFKYHVKPFDPTGEKFDPNYHEALYQAPIPGKEPGTVVDCQKVGYTIKDRVLRAAQVGVAQEAS